jgi:hypothetical protein
MRFLLFRLTWAVFTLLGILGASAKAQSFQVTPSAVNIVVPQGFNHANIDLQITGTAPGFDPTALQVSSNAAWVVPSIDTTSSQVILAFKTSSLVSSGNTATVTLTGNGVTSLISVYEVTSPLNVVKFANDPTRSRTYGIHQNGITGGALVIIDPLTNTNIACVTLGNKPADLAVSADGSELLAINSADGSLTAIDLATLQVRQTISLPSYNNWGAASTGAHVKYGAGTTVYYTDGSWAPVLSVYNRATGKVLQQVLDSYYGIGDFALSPDGSSLFGWIQYGWTAGWMGSYLVRYAVNADGTLNFIERTNPNYPTALSRDPIDTPVLLDTAGKHLFAKQVEVDPTSISNTQTSFPGPVYSISPGGEVAATSSAIFQASTGLSLFTLPVTTDIQTITPDYGHLVYFNPGTKTIGTVDLIAAIGEPILGRTLSPANGSIVLAPSSLQWTPVPGVSAYQVYLGQSESEVQDSGTNDPDYLGQVSTPNFALTGTLTPGVTYFWRVDSVTSDGLITGTVDQFTVSPIATGIASVDASTVQGDSDYEADVALTSTGQALTWSAIADQPWVSLVSATGSSPGTLSVRLDASQLSAGVHRANVLVSLSGTGQPSFTIPVTLQVDPLAITAMQSDPSSAIVYALSEQTPVNGGADRAYLLEIDTTSQAIKRVLRVGASATDLAVHNGDNCIYVTNWMGGQLLAIDKTTFQQTRGYTFKPFAGVGYSSGDAYRVSAGVQGRVIVEGEDQWITMSIYDTVHASILSSINVREGGGRCDPTGRYYYHGDDNDSGALLHKYDLTGDSFSEITNVRVSSVNYYGSRDVVVSENGQRIFWNGGVFDPGLNVLWLTADEIHSTSPDGKLAFSGTAVYDTTLQKVVLSMPAGASLSAYNSTTNRLVLPIGPHIQFVDFSSGSPLVAPLVSVPQVSATSVTLGWTDASLSNGFSVQDRLAGASDWQTVASGLASTSTSYTVTGLTPGQAYEFRISADSQGFPSAFSDTATATTTISLMPVAVTGTAASITTTDAALQGTANPEGLPATAYFQYGPTTGYGSTTSPQSIGSGTSTVLIGQTVSGMLPGATYHFRLAVTSAAGTALGGDQSWTALAAAPSVTVLAPTQISTSSFTLNGTVNPNGAVTMAWFDYGTTPALGTTTGTIGTGNATVPFSCNLSALPSNQTYYYRLVAANTSGTTASAILSVSTLSDTGTGTPISSPVAANDIAYTKKGEPCLIDVLANDFGTPQSSLHIISVGTPSFGTALVTQSGAVIYTPNSTFAGSDSFTYTMGDSTGGTSTATVVILNTYAWAGGIYNSLVGSGTSSFSQSGSVTLDVSRAGTLTGKLCLGNHAYPLAASLYFETAVITIADGTAPITLRVTLDPATQTVTGTVSRAGWKSSSTFETSRVPYTRVNPAPQAGRYTLLLSPSQTGTTGQGYGFATMQISPTGLVTITGRTGMGAPFTSSGYVNANAMFPLYAVAQTPQLNSVRGWVQFRNLAGLSDCDGLAAWTQASSGTSCQISLIGSRYIAPAAGGLILPFSAGKNNSTLEFGQGNTSIASVPVTLSATQISSTSGRLSKLLLNRQTGAYSGYLSISGSAGCFYGVAFQRQAMGAGVLLNRKCDGWVLFQAASVSGSGSPSGSTGGTITVSGSSTYTGGTTVGGGTLQSGDGGTSGGTLTINGGASGGLAISTGSGTLSGSGTIQVGVGGTVGSTFTTIGYGGYVSGFPVGTGSLVLSGSLTLDIPLEAVGSIGAVILNGTETDPSVTVATGTSTSP